MEQFLRQLQTIPEAAELIRRVEEGGCHAFNDFERVCPLIACFAGADR